MACVCPNLFVIFIVVFVGCGTPPGIATFVFAASGVWCRILGCEHVNFPSPRRTYVSTVSRNDAALCMAKQTLQNAPSRDHNQTRFNAINLHMTSANRAERLFCSAHDMKDEFDAI